MEGRGRRRRSPVQRTDRPELSKDALGLGRARPIHNLIHAAPVHATPRGLVPLLVDVAGGENGRAERRARTQVHFVHVRVACVPHGVEKARGVVHVTVGKHHTVGLHGTQPVAGVLIGADQRHRIHAPLDAVQPIRFVDARVRAEEKPVDDGAVVREFGGRRVHDHRLGSVRVHRRAAARVERRGLAAHGHRTPEAATPGQLARLLGARSVRQVPDLQQKNGREVAVRSLRGLGCGTEVQVQPEVVRPGGRRVRGRPHSRARLRPQVQNDVDDRPHRTGGAARRCATQEAVEVQRERSTACPVDVVRQHAMDCVRKDAPCTLR
eukprot:Opistho-1_new@40721